MYKLTRSHQGSALIVGFIIVVLLTIMTTSFLDKVLNLGKTSGGINSSAQSYTLATGIIEEQLMDSNMTKQSPWNIIERSEGTFMGTGRSLKASTGTTIVDGNKIPFSGKGNSTFSSDWNIISIGDPVQIVIPSGVDWSNVDLFFRVPNIPNETGGTGSTFSSGIILWTFGYSGASLYASGETNIFTMSTGVNGSAKKLTPFQGQTNTGVAMSFVTFNATYGSNCGSFQCTLKLSMIRPFVSTIGRSYSFLEYKIVFGASNPTIPSQYMVIDSSAYINGYLRSRQVRIPQITTNTATDFAILQ